MNIGITGGIGSGKTTICKVIEALGYPVYYADLEAKRIINENIGIQYELKELFGNEAFLDRTLNRTFIANIVFNNEHKLNELNEIIHPAVRRDFYDWSKKQNNTLIFQESALLFETNASSFFDASILVLAPIEERINRTIVRDNCTREEVKARIRTQWTDERKADLSTFQISNGNQDMVLEQILICLTKLNTYSPV
jgi:dephospho-CoA kinase